MEEMEQTPWPEQDPRGELNPRAWEIFTELSKRMDEVYGSEASRAAYTSLYQDLLASHEQSVGGVISAVADVKAQHVADTILRVVAEYLAESE